MNNNLSQSNPQKEGVLKKKENIGDFPGSPVVKTSPSNVGGAGSIPGWGVRSHMPRGLKNQNIKRKQYCNKFNKDFKNGPHQKKKRNLKKEKKSTDFWFFSYREDTILSHL